MPLNNFNRKSTRNHDHFLKEKKRSEQAMTLSTQHHCQVLSQIRWLHHTLMQQISYFKINFDKKTPFAAGKTNGQ
jgi:hypothetical protein